MSTYGDVQIMTSSTPIQEYEIELKLEAWKRRHSNAHITKVKIEKIDTSSGDYDILLIIRYQANSRVAISSATKKHAKQLGNFPGNYNNVQTNNLDGSKGIGYVARENGRFGSYPKHDDYSEES